MVGDGSFGTGTAGNGLFFGGGRGGSGFFIAPAPAAVLLLGTAGLLLTSPMVFERMRLGLGGGGGLLLLPPLPLLLLLPIEVVSLRSISGSGERDMASEWNEALGLNY